jgi:hypothetical protein
MGVLANTLDVGMVDWKGSVGLVVWGSAGLEPAGSVAVGTDAVRAAHARAHPGDLGDARDLPRPVAGLAAVTATGLLWPIWPLVPTSSMKVPALRQAEPSGAFKTLLVWLEFLFV